MRQHRSRAGRNAGAISPGDHCLQVMATATLPALTARLTCAPAPATVASVASAVSSSKTAGLVYVLHRGHIPWLQVTVVVAGEMDLSQKLAHARAVTDLAQ